MSPRAATCPCHTDGFLPIESLEPRLLLDGEQVITAVPSAAAIGPGSPVAIDVNYTTANPQDDTLGGLGLRLHFNSSQLAFQNVSSVLATNLFSSDAPQADAGNFDNDPSTDQFILISWIDLTGDTWPGVAVADLFNANFQATAGYTGTTVRFSASTLASGRTLDADPVTLTLDLSNQPSQVITATPSVAQLAPGGAVALDVNYTTANPLDATLGGLGLRLHFNSSQLTFQNLSSVLQTSFFSSDAPQTDAGNFDNDPTTDSFVLVSWIDLTGDTWPGTNVADLFTANFQATGNYTGSTVRFSASTTASGRVLDADPVALGLDASNLPAQVVTAAPTASGVEPSSPVSFAVNYTTANPLDATLGGLGLRLHFNSSQIAFNSLTNTLQTNIFSSDPPQADAQDFDGDASTDMFILVTWVDLNGDTWPGVNAAKLYDANFTTTAGYTGTTVRFSASTTASGRVLDADPVTITNVPPRVEIARIGFGAQVNKVIVSDDAFNDFDISIKGAGTAIIFMEANGRISIDTRDTDLKSALTIKPVKGSLDSSLHSINGTGALATLAAKGVNILGDIQFAGRINALTANNVAEQHLITLGGNPTDKPAKITLGRVTDATLNSTGPIQLSVLSWTDTDAATNKDSVTAPWITTITAKGDKKTATAARWDASLNLSGQGATKEALKTLKAETGSDLSFAITGNVGTLTYTGAVNGLTADVSGMLKTLTLGDTAAATVAADILGTVKAVRWLAGGVTARTIKSLSTTGNSKLGVVGDFNGDITATGDTDAKTVELGAATIKGGAVGDWNVTGKAGNVTLDRVPPQFSAIFSDAVTGFTVKVGNFEGDLAAGSLGKFDIKGNVANALIKVGSAANLANTLGTFKVGGTFVDSRLIVGVRAGANGVIDLADPSDDVVIGGPFSSIKSFTIVSFAQGTDPLFTAGVFPATVSINGNKFAPAGGQFMVV